MGAYLNKPVVEKEHDEGTGNGFKYGCTSMQGWRAHQEDAHNCVVNLHDGWHMFAVYDGHGGSEVSQFTAEKFPDFLKERKFWEESKLEECMQKAFVDFDDFLRSEPVLKELNKMANKGNDSKDEDDSEDEADRIETIEESAIPIHELIKRYGGDQAGIGARALLSAFMKDNCVDDDSEEEEDEDEEEEEEDEENSRDATVDSAESGDKANEEDVKKNGKKRCNKSPIQLSAKKSKSDGSNNGDEKKNGAGFEKGDVTNDDEVTSTTGNEVSKSAGSSTEEKQAVDAEDDDEDFVAEDEAEDEEEEDEEESDDEGCGSLLLNGGEIPGEDSGTTACVCLVGEKKIIVANAGDSRAVLCRAGKAIDLSIDHKPEDDIETKRIHNAGGKIEDGRVNGGLNLSRALGDHTYKKNESLPLKDQMITALPDVKMEELTDEDEFLIVACDGIWNSLDSQQVVDFVKKGLSEGKSCTEICDALCDSCLADSTDGDGTGCDNMTVICTQFVH